MISAVVPAYNEQERIVDTVDALLRRVGTHEVIVVDDASTDRTAELARSAGATVLSLPHNLGKAAALKAGVDAASGTILLLADADLGSSAEQLRALVAPLVEGRADMTIASFPVIPGKGGGSGLVVRLARRGIANATGVVMRDPLSGQRAITRHLVETVGDFDRRWGVEVALTIDALRAGFRVLEVPTSMTHRVTGRDLRGVVHRAGQLGWVALALARRGALR